MARKTVLVSDLSGKEIDDGKGAKVRITFADARSGSIELDVTADEGRQMGRKGRQVARRGRNPILVSGLDPSVSDAGGFVSRMVVHLIDDYRPAVNVRPRLVYPEDCSLVQLLAGVVHSIGVGVLGFDEDPIGVRHSLVSNPSSSPHSH
jgi:hypothetical protein